MLLRQRLDGTKEIQREKVACLRSLELRVSRTELGSGVDPEAKLADWIVMGLVTGDWKRMIGQRAWSSDSTSCLTEKRQ